MSDRIQEPKALPRDISRGVSSQSHHSCNDMLTGLINEYGFSSFDSKNKVQGVYVLSKNRNITYVGSSKNIRVRVLTHRQTMEFDSVHFIQIDDAFRRHELERMIIAKYAPSMNTYNMFAGRALVHRYGNGGLNNGDELVRYRKNGAIRLKCGERRAKVIAKIDELKEQLRKTPNCVRTAFELRRLAKYLVSIIR